MESLSLVECSTVKQQRQSQSQQVVHVNGEGKSLCLLAVQLKTTMGGEQDDKQIWLLQKTTVSISRSRRSDPELGRKKLMNCRITELFEG